MRARPIALAALIALAGCATTTAFQKSVSTVVPKMAADAEAYAATDRATDPATASARTAQAAALSTATGSAGDVTAQSTYAAWSAVEPWYEAYINADAALTPSERKVKVARCQYLDRAIAAEAGRPLGAGTRPSAS